MTTKNTRVEYRQALERLLEVCGADRTRWPARERLRFASFIAEDGEAQRLVAEATALDALLDRATQASEEREHALKERIVAAALRSGDAKLAVVARAGENPRSAMTAWARRFVPAQVPARREWPAAALLAASLVVGVLLGSSGTLDTTAQEVAEVTGYATADTAQLALGEEIVGFVEEDLL